jgi:tellurite methyltransferase
MNEDARERWNRRYREGTRPATPAPWLTDNRDRLPSPAGGGRALDVACGDGANAVWLAERGFEVDAVDISDVTIDALSALAVQRGLVINARRLDLEHDPLPRGGYDVIVQFNYLQRSLFGALADALAPGGELLCETVTADHVSQLGNRFDPRFLLAPGELQTAFADLEVVRHRELVIQRNGRPRAIASLLARRPQPLT